MSKKVFGTKEWAKHSLNMTVGCSNNCRYCYSRASYEKNDKSGVEWSNERINEDMLNRTFGKRTGTTMFPTSHDITSSNYKEATQVLKNLLSPGNDVLIVTKPSFMVIDYLTSHLSEFKEQILFRFTIGSSDDNILSFWEPGASSFDERLRSLQLAFDRGYFTSVSAEPLLDNRLEVTRVFVNKIMPYITDSIWIGKMNQPDTRIDLTEFSRDMKSYLSEYLNNQSDKNILSIYSEFKDNPKIKWKESIKKIVGIDIPSEAGLDI